MELKHSWNKYEVCRCLQDLCQPPSDWRKNLPEFLAGIWKRDRKYIVKLEKIKVLSANKREICITEFAEPTTWKTDKKLPSTALDINQLNASITITNSKGERGSPWRMPLELSKNPLGQTLIKIEKRTKIQKETHFLHLSEKPHLPRR